LTKLVSPETSQVAFFAVLYYNNTERNYPVIYYWNGSSFEAKNVYTWMAFSSEQALLVLVSHGSLLCLL
jgi:hypothetical protein